MSFQIVRRVTHRGDTQLQTTTVEGSMLRIGRGTSNDLLLDDLSVSLDHAVVSRPAGTVVVRDLTGASSVYVNSAPVMEKALVSGDVLRVGPFYLTVTWSSPEDPLVIAVEQRETAQDEAVPPLLPSYQLSRGRWTKTRLSLALSLLVLLGSVGAFALGSHAPFMPGQVSGKHAQFAAQCSSCHNGWKPVWQPVADKQCVTCHAAPHHFGDKSLAPSPACASCHSEHKGAAILAQIRDPQCVACHGALQAKEGGLPLAQEIHSFTDDHPEFALTLPADRQGAPVQRVRLTDKDRLADRGTVKLNHKVHLNPDLQGPDGPEPLKCASCHQPDQQSAYLRPIQFERDCMRCHTLDFDERLAGKTVTHGKSPREVRDELQASYATYYLMTHEAEMRARGVIRRLPGAPKTREELFVDDMTARAERFLYSPKTKKCLLCHSVERAGAIGQPAARLAANRLDGDLPTFDKPVIPNRWFPHSRFSHGPHLGLPQLKEKACLACHEAAPQSTKTRDVLMPGIASCRSCHVEPGGAGAQCIECHDYHDKAQSRLPAGIDILKPPSSSPAAPHISLAPPE